MAITASRYTLGMDREVGRETAASRGRASLMRKGMRQAKREKDYDKALGFAAGLEREGQAYGMTGNAADTSAISQGRVASRDALANQMRSQLPAMAGRSREENIAAAKSAGTFNATREQFNTANAGKKVMDEAGNISDAPPAGTTTSPKVDVPSTNTPTPPAASVKPAGTTTPANNAARVSLTDQLISGASKPQNKVPMRPSESGSPASPPEAPAKRKSVIMDNGVDVSEDIRKGLAGDRTGAFYTGKKSDAGPDMADPAIRSAVALASAAKGIDAAQEVIDKTPKTAKSSAPKPAAAKPTVPPPAENFTPDQKARYNAAMALATGAPDTPASKTPSKPTTRAVDPMLVDKRGFGSPDKDNPANWDFKPNPAATELPRIAGRGDDAAARLLQAFNPLTTVQTLKQGGKSALPAMMGEQPEYANANDRLKGDADVIKSAAKSGFLNAKRVKDQYGNSQLEVSTPVMRETGERVRPWLKRDAAQPSPREKGGPVTAGKPYLVGEKGPEIVVPEEDGEVIPNKDLKKKKARKALQAALSKK